jgi:hypothetical protein
VNGGQGRLNHLLQEMNLILLLTAIHRIETPIKSHGLVEKIEKRNLEKAKVMLSHRRRRNYSGMDWSRYGGLLHYVRNSWSPGLLSDTEAAYHVIYEGEKA